MPSLKKAHRCPHCSSSIGKRFRFISNAFLTDGVIVQCQSCGLWSTLSINQSILLLDIFLIRPVFVFFTVLVFVSWGNINQFILYAFISVLLLIVRGSLYSRARFEKID